VPEQQRHDNARDEEKDQIRLADVAALEAWRPLHLAYDERRDHARQHEQCEHVDQQRVPALRAEPRQGRVRIDRADHCDHDRREQDEEAPEDRGVHQPRQQALQQLALPHHDDRLLPCPGRDVSKTLCRLAHADQAIEQQRPAGEKHPRHDERGG
jgi:hypothetical protein